MRKKNTKPSWQSRRLKKIARFHAIISVSLFAMYVGLSVIYSPEFLLSDIKSKFSAAADETLVIMAKVLAPPVQPVVAGNAVCADGALSADLSWPADENSETFDITRNGSPLITGLTQPHYSDQNVAVGNSYSYVVTARGPMGPGFAISDPVSITTPAECSISIPPPSVTVTSLFSKSSKEEDGLPTSEEKRPVFSGTTTIPNGAILIMTVHSSQVITGETTANSNGYWSWRPPVDLEEGRHILYVTATDPLDPSHTADFTFEFFIRYPESDTEKDTRTPAPVQKPPTPIRTGTNPPRNDNPFAQQQPAPLDFSLRLEKDWVFQGKALPLDVTVNFVEQSYLNNQAEITYQILDEKDNELYSVSEIISLREGMVISKNINLPKKIPGGNYHLRTGITIDTWTISKQEPFEIKPEPILRLGGGFVMTYPELLSKLGTASIITLLLLLAWLFLFSREYWLYLHLLRHITEKSFIKMGFVPIKKERRGNK